MKSDNMIELYKHSNNVDVAIEPLALITLDDSYKVLVQWYNITNPSKIFPIKSPETVFIKKSDFKNWHRYTP